MFCAVLLPAWAPACLATTAPPFEILLEQVRSTAPALLESRANIGMAQGRADQASALPNPRGDAYFENLDGPSIPVSGYSPKQSTFSLSEPIELGGKRNARMAAGSADIEAAEAQDHLVLARFAYDLAMAYANAEAAEARVKLYAEALAAANEDLRGTQALVDAGRQAGVRAKQASAAALAAQSDLEAAKADTDQALARLSVLIAVPQGFTEVVPSLLPLTDHPLAPAAAPKIFPAVILAEAERDVALRKLDIEKSRAWPDMTATVGVRRLEGDRATVLVGGVSFPIPVFDQNSGNISAAGSAVAAADARLAAARAEAETGWRAALLQANAATTRLIAAKSASAAAEEAYQPARIGFDAGKVSLLDLLSARRALTDAQLRLLDVRVAQISAHAALARLSGTLPFGAPP